MLQNDMLRYFLLLLYYGLKLSMWCCHFSKAIICYSASSHWIILIVMVYYTGRWCQKSSFSAEGASQLFFICWSLSSDCICGNYHITSFMSYDYHNCTLINAKFYLYSYCNFFPLFTFILMQCTCWCLQYRSL